VPAVFFACNTETLHSLTLTCKCCGYIYCGDIKNAALYGRNTL